VQLRVRVRLRVVLGPSIVRWRRQRAREERVCDVEKCRGLEGAQLLDAFFELVLFVLELLLFAQALSFLERLVLAMPLFVRRIGGVDAFLLVAACQITLKKNLRGRTSS
jgi:hypothetical protein